MKDIIIIGAGLGGLAAGISLQSKGFNVRIIEQNAHPGGKMMGVDLDEYHFDFGPNTITMPQIFQRVIRNAGGNPDEYFQFIKLEKHTKNIFSNGEVLFQSIHSEEMIEQFQRLDPFAAKQYESYLSEVRRLYELAEKGFFYRVFDSWVDYLSPSLSKAFMSVRPFEKLDHFHRRYFQNPNILNVFNRYATYIGSSPFACPATFALIGHLEMNDGVYYVKGGNTKIAEGFAKYFVENGGQIDYSTRVSRIQIEQQKVAGVVLEDGTYYYADSVIVNGDFITATRDLLEEEVRQSHTNNKLDQYKPSVSAFVILAGLKNRLDTIHHHQVFFPNDYREEFVDIFKHQRLPVDPTIYISHSAYSDPNVTKGSNLFILVNAPAIDIDKSTMHAYKKNIYSKLEQRGIPIRENLEVEKVFTPNSIKKRFSAYKGSLYGIASHSMKDAFLRPSNVSKDIKGLYYVGGTTHPGGGSPMVTISGLNIANFISEK